jgi:hypothetical protein
LADRSAAERVLIYREERNMLRRAAFIGLLLVATAVGAYVLIPSTVGAQGGPGNVVVICSSCAYPGMPRQGHLILMDGRTGEIWAYSDNAVGGGEKPTYVGTLSAVGQPIVKKK